MVAAVWTIRDARSQEEWTETLELLNAAYVGERFTRPEDAQQTFSLGYLQGQGDLLVATDPSKQIVGAVLLVSQNSELRQIARAGEAEFRLLAVNSQARGKGIGRQLVEECLRRARGRGVSRMVLSTQPSQHAAHKLYEDLGFVRIAERDWQTASGSPRWVYSVELV